MESTTLDTAVLLLCRLPWCPPESGSTCMAPMSTRWRRRRSGVAVLGTLCTLVLMRLLSARSCGTAH